MMAPAAPPTAAPMMAPFAVEPFALPTAAPTAPPAAAPMMAPDSFLLSEAQALAAIRMPSAGMKRGEKCMLLSSVAGELQRVQGGSRNCTTPHAPCWRQRALGSI